MTSVDWLEAATRLVLAVTAVPFLAVGAQALIDPQRVMDLVRTPLPTSDARSSISGAYGGVPLAMALVLLLAAAWAGAWQVPALVVLLAYSGGYALGRLVAWARDRQLDAFARRWLVVETTVAVVAALLLGGHIAG